MGENIIQVGATGDVSFYPENIYTIDGTQGVTMIGDQLSIDTMRAVVDHGVRFTVGDFIPAGSSGLITRDGKRFHVRGTAAVHPADALPYGTVLYWLHDGVRMARLICTGVRQVGKNAFEIQAESEFGILTKRWHNGGVYNGTTVGALLREIIGNAFVLFADQDVAATTVVGYLPRATARDNLLRVMMAFGITVERGGTAMVPVFRFVNTADPVQLPDDRIFIGGSVDKGMQETTIEITEHSYYQPQGAETVLLFDNTSEGVSADGLLITFGEPVFGLTHTGTITLSDVTANTAVVSGIGTVSGKKYGHMTKVRKWPEAGGSADAETKTVTDNGLITGANAYGCLRRLHDYYNSGDAITADILVDGEKPNQRLTFTDAFGLLRTAWLKSMTYNASSIIRARATLIADYAPKWRGNTFTSSAILDPTHPTLRVAAATRVRIVLIGGGWGGDGGMDGKDGRGADAEAEEKRFTYVKEGASRRVFYNGGGEPAGIGGKGGKGGDPGKIAVYELDIPAGTLRPAFGQGGAAGGPNGGTGQAGTATTLTIDGRTYSSDDGENISQPIINLITGEALNIGLAGSAGRDGCPGGASGVRSDDGYWGWQGDGQPGGDTTGSASGGTGGDGAEAEGYLEDLYASAAGGGGGGAGYGSTSDSAGAPGQAGTITGTMWTDYVCKGGDGGDGGDSADKAEAQYGCGGDGGDGGGGGGDAGGGYLSLSRTAPGTNSVKGGQCGRGGTGGRGGKGGRGCVIIYLAEA